MTKDDCWQLEENETTEIMTKELEDCWNREARKYLKKLKDNVHLNGESLSSPKKASNIYKTKSDPKEELSLVSVNIT